MIFLRISLALAWLVMSAKLVAAEEHPSFEVILHTGEARQYPEAVFKSQNTLVNFVYLNCDVTCPTTLAVTAQMADTNEAQKLGLSFVTFSVDPQNDTPIRLNDIRTKMTESANWTWFTGTPENIAKVMSQFGVTQNGMSHHSSDYYLISGQAGKVRKIKAIVKKKPKDAKTVLSNVSDLLQDR